MTWIAYQKYFIFNKSKIILTLRLHIDFVIYYIMNKEFLLVIEVDGYAFHNEKSKQYQRDIIKNSICKKCNISLLRLHTIGSSEKEQIKNELDKQWQQ